MVKMLGLQVMMYAKIARLENICNPKATMRLPTACRAKLASTRRSKGLLFGQHARIAPKENTHPKALPSAHRALTTPRRLQPPLPPVRFASASRGIPGTILAALPVARASSSPSREATPAPAAPRANTLVQSRRPLRLIVRPVFLASIRQWWGQSPRRCACRVRQASTLRSKEATLNPIACSVVLARSQQRQPPPQELCAPVALQELTPPPWELHQKRHASNVQQASIQHLRALIRAPGACSAALDPLLTKARKPA